MLITAAEIRNVRFKKASFGTRGYDSEEVDAFLAVIEAALTGAGALSAADVRNAAFSKSSFGTRGYDEAEVDALLDVIELQFAQREQH